MCGTPWRDDGSDLFDRSLESSRFELVKCKSCGHCYTLISSDTEVSGLYEDGDYEVRDFRGTLLEKVLSSEYLRIVNKIGAELGGVGSILDFGCGKGRFLGLAKRKGWEVMGVETSMSRASFARRSYGLTVSSDYYEAGLIAEKPFDVITLFHVLEHLPDPKVLVGALIEDNLSPNGRVVIEVPNYRSLQARLAGNKWVHLDIPRHISHFSKCHLLSLFAEVDLKPVRREYFSIHLGVLGMIQSMLTILGYRGSLIFDLKYRRTLLLMISVVCVAPLAFLAELIASCFGFGGIIRLYGRRK